MDQCCAGIRGAEPREGAALVGVEESGFVGHVGESDGHDSFQYFGDGSEEDYYAKGRRSVVGGFPWLVQHNPICMFEAWWVVAEGDEGGEQVEEDGGLYGVYSLPDPVEYTIRARGGRGGAFA